MAHIKCRYDEVYCGWYGKWGMSGEPCDADHCDSGLGADYDEWNIPICEAAYLVECEFEKTVKNYEYISETGFNRHLAELHIGKRIYDRISYLEIDGRVLIGKEDKTE